jgi:hypothetical protein
MPTPDHRPVAELEPLAPLAGRWASEGRTVATEDEPSVRIIGTDVYEWLGGGYFLVHEVHVRMGETVVEVLEVIGEFDGSSYAMRSFDQDGAATTMRATVGDDGGLLFTGDGMRAAVSFGEDDQSMRARWERRASADTWSHWMDMHFTRI